jgi:RNA polymerase sigma-70 factor (ECF subfamily)
MNDEAGWDLGPYRPILRLMSMHMNFDPCLHRRFDESDLVQEALARAQENLHQCRGETKAERIAWLRTILKNTFLDLVRKHTGKDRNVYLEQSIHDAAVQSSAWVGRLLPDEGSSPSGRAEKLEQLARLDEALAALRREQEDQYEAVVRKHLRGEPVEQVGEAMGKSGRAVGGLLYRGLQRLRELLGADDHCA